MKKIRVAVIGCGSISDIYMSNITSGKFQILDKKTWTENHPFHMSDRTYSKNMLPATDDILERAVNISVGVVDKGLGAGTGINVNSTEEEINMVAKNIREIVLSL